ncbi:MAG: hypothetical protein ACRC2R_04475 [Xenococcaceae cyanobacterium]
MGNGQCCTGQWAKGKGQWAMGNGQWAKSEVRSRRDAKLLLSEELRFRVSTEVVT